MKDEKQKKRAMNDPISDVIKAKKRQKIAKALVLIGGTILFTSWITQNYYKARWLDKRMYLERSQLAIDIETSNAKHWLLMLNVEANTEQKNEARYMLAAYNLIKSTSSILAWEKARVADDDSQIDSIQTKNETHVKADELLKNRDLAGLIKLVREVSFDQNNSIAKLDKEFFLQLYQARSKDSFWDRFFLLSYIIGSVLIGIRWILINMLV